LGLVDSSGGAEVSGRVAIRPGLRVRWEARALKVVGVEAGAVRLRDERGESLILSLTALFDDPSFEILDAEPRSPAQPGDLTGIVPKRVRERARERLAHLLEAETGYRSGHPEDAAPEEPRPDYDPDLTTRTDRYANKAREIDSGVSTLERWWAGIREEGISALVDKRFLSERSTEPRVDPRLAHVLDDLLAEWSKGSTRRLKTVRTQLVARVRCLDGEPVPLPSDSTLDRLIKARDGAWGVLKPASQRDGRHRQPETPYQHLSADYPGQWVLLDHTPMDCYALDHRTGHPQRVFAGAAFDVFSRSVAGRRFTVGEPNAVDACLLLLDMLRPRAHKSSWPASARWNYVGVPERVLAPIKERWNVENPAGKPVLRPEQVVADGAWIFRSRALLLACRRLESTLQIARPLSPTDKAQLERFWRTYQELLQHLPGYLGSNTAQRGANAESDAFYFVQELEDVFDTYVACEYHRRPHEGLQLPGQPQVRLSPNEMYEEGIARAGFVSVPASPTIWFELLPTEWRPVHHYGVDIDRVRYDGEALEPLREQRSRYGGKANGHWPFRKNPADLSRIYFYSEEERSWKTVHWLSEEATDRPFGEMTLMLAKRTLRDRGARGVGPRQLADAIIEVIESEHEYRHRLSTKERGTWRRELANAERARVETPDPGGPSSDGVHEAPRPEEQEAVEVWATVD
jgi:hypothetical protein